MKYISTRGEQIDNASKVILNGIANDGGLYVPSSFPTITPQEIEEMIGFEYEKRASHILSKFLTDYTYEELMEYVQKAYKKFDGEPAPLVKVDDNTYMLELWHGPTLAFKDMALTVLPYLLMGARKKDGIDKKTLILVATSGDTGKAALEGFKDVEGAEIIVFYPNEGVSLMQKLQMQTTEGKNVHVVGIEGNFDDAQNAVKDVFDDGEMRKKLFDKGYMLSSANSINFGRLVPQIVYYVSAYVDLLGSGEIENGDQINIAVPSGNFGNILAAYYAYRMGLPIKHLIVASNQNNVLTDFFNSGEYDINREFYKTISPSMDILISSNLERLLFEFADRDSGIIRELMAELKNSGRYQIDQEKLSQKFPQFLGYYSTEEETFEVIDNFFEQCDYLLDPHTAVGVSAYFKYISDTLDTDTPAVVVSTANPYKFPQDVYYALTKVQEDDPIKSLKKLQSYTGIKAPQAIAGLDDKPLNHDLVVPKSKIKDTILKLLKKEDNNE
ncbi:MAG: threonine synthase [Bacillota bacterium]|jgi:threonine synthase|nr:threonine synthase [Bacillota bacterium]HHU43220.1 threonine synthase [Clostridiales bacterium]